MASEWVLKEYIEIKQNPYYWKKPAQDNGNGNGNSTENGGDILLPIIAGVAGAATVIVIGGFAVLKRE